MIFLMSAVAQPNIILPKTSGIRENGDELNGSNYPWIELGIEFDRRPVILGGVWEPSRVTVGGEHLALEGSIKSS